MGHLERAVSERGDDIRNMQLATVSADGRPRLRTVVLRGVELTAVPSLEVHSDARAEKVRDIAAGRDHVALLAWSSAEQLQLRFEGCRFRPQGRQGCTRPMGRSLGRWSQTLRSSRRARQRHRRSFGSGASPTSGSGSTVCRAAHCSGERRRSSPRRPWRSIPRLSAVRRRGQTGELDRRVTHCSRDFTEAGLKTAVCARH